MKLRKSEPFAMDMLEMTDMQTMLGKIRSAATLLEQATGVRQANTPIRVRVLRNSRPQPPVMKQFVAMAAD